jgi:large subunit ribosomal protein L13
MWMPPIRSVDQCRSLSTRATVWSGRCSILCLLMLPLQIVGRLAPQVAKLLMGKHKPTYQPHVDCGDWVIVTNAKDAVLTGNKMRTKLYQWHTQYPGGLKSLTARQMHERAPERLIEIAVKGMLPPNNMRELRMRRLRVFAGSQHPHLTQSSRSEKYAPGFLALTQPRPFHPAEKEVTGNLVKNYFGNDVSQAEMKEKIKGLTPLTQEEMDAKLHAELARLAKLKETESPALK